MDELLSRQEEVIQELENLDERLKRTIDEFRASIANEAPSKEIGSPKAPKTDTASIPKAA
jgi:hypothetical protein